MGRNLCSVLMRKSSMSMIFLLILKGICNFGAVVTCEKWHQAVKNNTHCSCYLRVVGGFNCWGCWVA